MNIFDYARQKVAQCKAPTDLYRELSKLARKRRYGRVQVKPDTRYPWMDREDICG